MEFTEEELKYVPSELAYDYIKELEEKKKEKEVEEETE